MTHLCVTFGFSRVICGEMCKLVNGGCLKGPSMALMSFLFKILFDVIREINC